jgi:hypothetical protein
MSETMSVGLTEDQREILLRGLRFVRSAVALEVYDSTPETDIQRSSKLREIRQLAEYLEGARPAGTTARV